MQTLNVPFLLGHTPHGSCPTVIKCPAVTVLGAAATPNEHVAKHASTDVSNGLTPPPPPKGDARTDSAVEDQASGPPRAAAVLALTKYANRVAV